MPHEIVKKRLDEKGIADLLVKVRFGHFSTVDSEGKPYTVPLDYRYVDGTIYFHGGGKGQKLENLRGNPNVCFEVTSQEPLNYLFRSSGKTVGRSWECVIVRGKVEEVVDKAEKARVYGEAMRHTHKVQPETITGRAATRIK